MIEMLSEGDCPWCGGDVVILSTADPEDHPDSDWCAMDCDDAYCADCGEKAHIGVSDETAYFCWVSDTAPEGDENVTT